MARVLVAMSGGVDSSVAAALLAREGHEVIGVTFNQWPASRTRRNTQSGCCTPRTIDDARHVCQILGAPHYVLNFRAEFDAAVVNPWAHAYLRGETPNPCVLCNDRVRFPEMIRKADEVGADFVATGHYARVAHGASWRLLRARDAAKDQSYVLHMLQQDQLRRVRLPLGDLLKPEVRQIAAEFDLPVARKPDSQEICFVPDGDYAAVVQRHGTSGKGPIVESDGRVIGRHDGIETVTIGQRRGLDLGGGAGRRYGHRDRRRAQHAGRRPARRSACGYDNRARRALDHGTRVDAAAASPRCRPVPTPARHRRELSRDPHPGCRSRSTSRRGRRPRAKLRWFYRGDEVLGGGVIDRPEES